VSVPLDSPEGPGERDGGTDPLSEILLEVARAPDRDPAALALGAGASVGGFLLLRRIGAGRSTLLFEALDRDRKRGERCAVLVLRRSAGGSETGVPPDLEGTARLSHPAIAAVLAFGLHAGTPYVVLEALRGETLAARLAREPISLREAIRIGLDVARALAYAHREGVLHGDLDLSNVFLCEGGGVKLIGFGARGEPPDPRADLAALAALLLRLLGSERSGTGTETAREVQPLLAAALSPPSSARSWVDRLARAAAGAARGTSRTP
jgi:serine/threonine protein kinase